MYVSNQNNDIQHKTKCTIKNVTFAILFLFCSFVIGCFTRLIMTKGEKVFYDDIDIGFSILILIFIGGLWFGIVFLVVIGCIACFIGLLEESKQKQQIIITI